MGEEEIDEYLGGVAAALLLKKFEKKLFVVGVGVLKMNNRQKGGSASVV